jgi:hypothetical protein
MVASSYWNIGSDVSASTAASNVTGIPVKLTLHD